MSTTDLQAYRGSLLLFLADPAFSDNAHAWHEDGLLIVADGKVRAAGDYVTLRATLPAGTTVHDYSGKLLMPGFIDTHIHYPQTDMICLLYTSPSPRDRQKSRMPSSA